MRALEGKMQVSAAAITKSIGSYTRVGTGTQIQITLSIVMCCGKNLKAVSKRTT